MDAKDRKLLYLLSKNSRESVKQLSKNIRLSDSTTIYRLRDLQRRGVIQSCHCVIDTSRLGYKAFRFYFSFTKTVPGDEKEIIEWLAAQETVCVLAQCYGAIDVVVISWVSDERQFYAFFQEFKQRWGKYVRTLDFFIYLKTAHFARSYLEEKTPEHLFTTGLADKVAFDDLDMTILNQLSVNARESALVLSVQCDVSAKTIIERIRRMERSRIIAGYGIGIDAGGIGKQYYKLGIILETPLSESQIVSFASTIKGIVYVDFSLGRFDMELNVEVDSCEDFERILEKIKQATSSVVHAESFQIRKYHKLRFI